MYLPKYGSIEDPLMHTPLVDDSIRKCLMSSELPSSVMKEKEKGGVTVREGAKKDKSVNEASLKIAS